MVVLQKDGRITNVDLADAVGLSPPPCLRRLRVLEEERYILGYHAELNPKKLGLGVMAFVYVGLKSQANRDVRAFEETVRGWRNVREAYALQGETDFLLKCVAKDLTKFQEFVTARLLTLENVRSVKSAFVIKGEKKGLPIGRKPCASRRTKLPIARRPHAPLRSV